MKPETYSEWLARVKEPVEPLRSGWIDEQTPPHAEPNFLFWLTLIVVAYIVVMGVF